MKRIIFSGILVLWGVGLVWAGPAFDELQASFTHQGKPVHPFVVEQLVGDLAEEQGMAGTTVDVAAESMQYADSPVVSHEGGWWSDHDKDPETGIPGGSFWYKWLGTMSSGVHVVETGSSGGGSGFFMELLFLRVSQVDVVAGSGEQKKLLLSVVGRRSLGDRYEGKIDVLPDKVLVPMSRAQSGGGAVDEDLELVSP